MSDQASDTAARVLAEAARAFGKVAFSGRSADDVIRQPSAGSAVRAISLGTLRWYWRLNALLEGLLGQTRVTSAVRSLLLVSLHQLEHSRNPPEAVVSSSVDAVRMLGQPRAAGLVNALLRRFLRERDRLLEAISDCAAAAHPRWLFDALQEHWPDHWRGIVESDNTQPPMTLRVNRSRVSRDQYLAQLRDAGTQAHAVNWLPSALVLERPLAVFDLPGFAQGSVSVQDAGAQLASALLDCRRGERVLDACAAPGGKTGAILEHTSDLELTAVDVDPTRSALIGDNLRRLGFEARVLTADLRADLSWWDGSAFDRILLDAPCSGTGVIRRHPDIKLLRVPSDIAGFVATQRRLLERCRTLLRPGGRLLYCTCSLLPDENERLVESLLSADPRLRVLPFPPDVALPPQVLMRSVGLQLLPGNAAATDGFYYACLTVT
jgi:16S rRNA (cytosine967-C5)-methyltransferase